MVFQLFVVEITSFFESLQRKGSLIMETINIQTRKSACTIKEYRRISNGITNAISQRKRR